MRLCFFFLYTVSASIFWQRNWISPDFPPNRVDTFCREPSVLNLFWSSQNLKSILQWTDHHFRTIPPDWVLKQKITPLHIFLYFCATIIQFGSLLIHFYFLAYALCIPIQIYIFNPSLFSIPNIYACLPSQYFYLKVWCTSQTQP